MTISAVNFYCPYRLISPSILLAFCFSLVTADAAAFPDIQTHWAKDCINQMASRNLVTGYPDGTFRPNGSITRAEFAVLMLNAFPDAEVKRNKLPRPAKS
ncbi:S-layer homology domain-containing protein [Coleofasciculus chthonoplastes]|jgi:hypothetical protein|uniref:S-layer homology domain-containing protein n=1 Tax=Coleofasciculus chthonoplastes TaxID=64178 RepID=UPI003303EF19